jgi:two-component system sensor histidine kinase UhpB
VGKNSLDFELPGQVWKMAKDKLDRVLGGESFILEGWAEANHAQKRYFIMSFNPIRSKNKVIGAAVFAKDSTEKKKTEMALLESEDFSSALLENSPNPIVVVNPDSSIRYVNPAFEKVTGYTVGEALGLKSPFPWWPKEKIREFLEGFFTGYATHNNLLERCYLRKDGQPIWIVIHIKPIQVNGEVKYYLANWLDISERKKTEIEIKQSREHLRSFSSYLQEKLEDERKYISKEIHDELGQMLTALRIDLSWLAKRLSPELEALTQKTRSMITLVDETDKVVRRISANLRPPILDDFGLGILKMAGIPPTTGQESNVQSWYRG